MFTRTCSDQADHATAAREALDTSYAATAADGATTALKIPLAPLSVVTAVVTTNGSMVVFVSRQLGHANPNITLSIYAHLYAHADHAATARAALDASHLALTQSAR